MTQHERHFEAFQPHTRLKHAILDAYIVAWAMKLLRWGGAGRKLAIIDAFAGPGRDEAGHDGSPLIAIRRAREAMANARAAGLNDAEVHVYAIEKRPHLFRALQSTLAPFAEETPGLIHILRGELVDHIDLIRNQIDTWPAFYFLDPFGIKGLHASTYPKALGGAHNEIFALFSDVGVIRLHGLVCAERADATDEIAAIRTAPSFFPEFDDEDVAAANEAAARANEALDSSIPKSREHLSNALGDDAWVRMMEHERPDRRADAFLSLFQEALKRAGARRILVVPMRNDTGRKVYALVHASKSVQGFVTMKEAVTTGLRGDYLPMPAAEAIKAALSIDLSVLIRGLMHAFEGREVLWATGGTGLRDLLFANTDLFPFQAGDLKVALKEAKILRRVDRREVCVFPSLN